ncbi:MAG: 4Fe-4S dicluster domain-containing protein [Pseudomonadota bacterium]
MTLLPAQTEKKLGLVIDLDICVGCHACVISCKEWNTAGYGAPLSDLDAYGDEPVGSFLNRIHTFEIMPEGTATQSNGSASGGNSNGSASGASARPIGDSIAQDSAAMVVHFPKSCLHCEDAPCVTVCPTGASFKRSEDGIVLVEENWCIGCGLCAWACPYGAREMDPVEKVMKKCTLCVDRIYNDNIAEEDRVPSCVRTCPANARHYGDLGDPNSAVSQLVAERGGFDLMPEQGTKPVNQYLPPRKGTRPAAQERPIDLAALADPPLPGGATANGATPGKSAADTFFSWVDRTLERV